MTETVWPDAESWYVRLATKRTTAGVPRPGRRITWLMSEMCRMDAYFVALSWAHRTPFGPRLFVTFCWTHDAESYAVAFDQTSTCPAWPWYSGLWRKAVSWVSGHGVP